MKIASTKNASAVLLIMNVLRHPLGFNVTNPVFKSWEFFKKEKHIVVRAFCNDECAGESILRLSAFASPWQISKIQQICKNL